MFTDFYCKRLLYVLARIINKNVRKITMARLWLKCLLIIFVISITIFVYSLLNVRSEIKIYKKVLPQPTKIMSDVYSEQLINNKPDCNNIEIAMVCADYNSTQSLITVIKSLLFYRTKPLRFHFIVDEICNKTLNVLLKTWNLPHGVYGLLKVILPEILAIEKVIVLDTDITVLSDIYDLWKIFNEMENDGDKSKNVFALAENQSDWYKKKSDSGQRPWPAIGRGFNTGVMLMNLKALRETKFSDLWINTTQYVIKELYETSLADQDIINAVIKNNPSMVYVLDCTWNVQLSDHTISDQCYSTAKRIQILHWNSPRKQSVKNKNSNDFNNMHKVFLDMNGNLLRRKLFGCDPIKNLTYIESKDNCRKFSKNSAITYRTHLFIREYQYDNYIDADVGLVTQCSFDRITLLDELCKRWPGTISVAVYLTDAEVQLFLDFVRNSDVLKFRKNIAYHVVYKDGEFYPINYLRNVAISQIQTPYIFQLDIDFLPPVDLYEKLIAYIYKLNRNVTDASNRNALIVPAFETQRYRFTFPVNKEELLKYLNYGVLYTFRYHVWTKGHAATNYSNWKTATKPYQVTWEPDFEPYIVVHKSAPLYDERFIGFGWNKVSYITHLTALGYSYIVLPDVFIIHRPHAPSLDIGKFRTDALYRRCLKKLKDQFVDELIVKYGNNSLIKLKKTKE
ncbi:Similar to Large1: LARGE xylosyl- and glucuronyltransferase 1 (Mus musculus) [Cotesia congregata]|uniref:Similar to Large1: LARGE xylosyl- and glucuronyltransferase 1 (Mus musculus) n=1 Tax=Cotesia congregata TaxID=51543 RepID=A0A8J2H6M6_COTCN|nr:Similar to Large1: LARGE xylosyl- and glucuronyltransferase 1 (Mus musculus) [Cotesia congregata]